MCEVLCASTGYHVRCGNICDSNDKRCARMHRYRKNYTCV